MRRTDRAKAVVALAVLTACSGGGGSASPPARVTMPPASATTASDAANVTFTVKIPGETAAASTGRRAPQFVSSATQGVLVQAYVDPQSANPSPYGTYAFDLSSGSNACTPAAGAGRTCTFALPLAAGTYDFVDTLYDAAPANGSFGSAKVLGVGRATQTIARYVVNTVAISIGGRVASVVLGPVRDVAVNTAPATYALSVTALDADGVPIVAGTADPYDNPVTVTASDTGAHTTLVLNGGTPTSSVTTSHSADTIAVAYDGTGPAGYFATFSATANGASAAPAGFDSFNATLALVSFLGSGETQTETIVEPHNAGPFAVTPAANCANLTTAGPVSGTGSTETFVLASGTLAGTCYVTASSETGTASVPIKVVNLVPGIVTIPQHRLFVASGTAVQAFDTANGGTLVQTISGAATTLQDTNGIARDSAGSIYVTDAVSGTVDVFAGNASGNAAPLSQLIVPSPSGQGSGLPGGVGVDRAGDVIADSVVGFTNATLSAFASGATTPTVFGSSGCPIAAFAIGTGLAVDASGKSYLASTCGQGGNTTITEIAFEAAQYQKVITTGAASIGGIAIDLSGDVFVTDANGTSFAEYGPTAFGAAEPTLVGTGLNKPGGIAVANDGTVYVVTHPSGGNTTTTAIAVFPPGATAPASTFPIAAASENASLSL